MFILVILCYRNRGKSDYLFGYDWLYVKFFVSIRLEDVMFEGCGLYEF